MSVNEFLIIGLTKDQWVVLCQPDVDSFLTPILLYRHILRPVSPWDLRHLYQKVVLCQKADAKKHTVTDGHVFLIDNSTREVVMDLDDGIERIPDTPDTHDLYVEFPTGVLYDIVGKPEEPVP